MNPGGRRELYRTSRISKADCSAWSGRRGPPTARLMAAGRCCGSMSRKERFIYGGRSSMRVASIGMLILSGLAFVQGQVPKVIADSSGSYLGVMVQEIDAERAKALKLPEEAGV